MINVHFASSDDPRTAAYVDARDDRAKFAYHHGTRLMREILDRLLPALPRDLGEWLYDQTVETHVALYGATLFELHLKSPDGDFAADDVYSNGWPVLWRLPRDRDTEQKVALYTDIGEHVPDGAEQMISPPEVAWEPAENVAEMMRTASVGEAPSAAWKLFCDMYLKGMVDIRRDENGRILKDGRGEPGLHVTWELTPAGHAADEEVEASDSETS